MYSVIGFVWPWQSILYAFEELFHNLTQHDMIDMQKMINGVLTLGRSSPSFWSS